MMSLKVHTFEALKGSIHVLSSSRALLLAELHGNRQSVEVGDIATSSSRIDILQ